MLTSINQISALNPHSFHADPDHALNEKDDKTQCFGAEAARIQAFWRALNDWPAPDLTLKINCFKNIIHKNRQQFEL